MALAMAGPNLSLQTITIRSRPRVIASDWRTRLRNAPLLVWFAVVGLLVFGAVRDPSLRGWLISVAVVILVIALPNALARVNVRIRITPDSVEYWGILRVPRRCPRSEIVGARRLQLALLGPRFRFSRLVCVPVSGRASISIQEEWFALDDLARMLDALAIPVSDVDEPLTPRRANELYPGAASFALVHRFEIVAVGFVVLLGLIGTFVPVKH